MAMSFLKFSRKIPNHGFPRMVYGVNHSWNIQCSEGESELSPMSEDETGEDKG